MGLQNILTVLLIATMAVSCQQDQPSSSDTDAIGNRPQNYDRFIAIAKLSEPSLLENAGFRAGEVVVDESLRARILSEQSSFIARIQDRYDDVQVLHQYRLVLNAVVLAAPIRFRDEFRNFAEVSYLEGSGQFSLPPAVLPASDEQPSDEPLDEEDLPDDLADRNSASFLGAYRVHQRLGIDGSGVSVGVIDTGIDYHHTMFEGSGRVSEFRRNRADRVESGSFPTAKVVGGIDLVGAHYNPASPDFDDHIPMPDGDPLDLQGHGSHVAGSIAGIGDGRNSFDGVAPGATLHAIKVFSDGGFGSTSDHIVIAALEYAADPNGDLDPEDHLDVVNLSLGSSFGTEHILYEEAVRNLADGGDTVILCSAGNSGDIDYVVGAPSTAAAALSVAASIDDTVADGDFADALARFSSIGPRSLDGALKPEISSPGYDIISAKFGSGNRTVRMSGTSMASPNAAGVAALLRRTHPQLRAADIKALMMNTAKDIKPTDSRTSYSIAQQGAGRVRADKAALSEVLVTPGSLSLGIHRLESTTRLDRVLTIANLSATDRSYRLTLSSEDGIELSAPGSIDVEAGDSAEVDISITLNPDDVARSGENLDAHVVVASGRDVVARVPILAVMVKPSNLHVASHTEERIQVENRGRSGTASIFRLLGEDSTIASEDADPDNLARRVACDLTAVGYRIIEKERDGEIKRFLQFAASVASPVTTWHLCELSVQIDGNADGRTDQELVGSVIASLAAGHREGENRFFSFLLDFNQMRRERAAFERRYDLFRRDSADYVEAALDGYSSFYKANHGYLAVVEAELGRVDGTSDGVIHAKVGMLSSSDSPNADDFLGDATDGSWERVALSDADLGGDAEVDVGTGAAATFTLDSTEDTIVFFPFNLGRDGAEAYHVIR